MKLNRMLFLKEERSYYWIVFFMMLYVSACSPPPSLIENGFYPVILDIPSDLQSYISFRVIDSQKKRIYPAQKWENEQVVFLVEDTSTQKMHYKIEGSDTPFYEDKVLMNIDKEKLSIYKEDQPILVYHLIKQLPEGKEKYYERSGFIHPLYSPNGKILTDDFPAGHTHHHGIFFAFVNTTFRGEKVDFWNQQQQTGGVELERLAYYKGGPVYGKFIATNAHFSTKHGKVLEETWDVRIFNSEPYRINIQTTLKAVTDDTLFVHNYHYGGMAFRGSKTWNPADTINFKQQPFFTTSEGKDRIAANHSRPVWSALVGQIGKDTAGVIMYGHATNEYATESIRIHPKMPYYCIAPMVENPFIITKDKPYKATYTLLSFDGEVPVDKVSISSY